MKRAFRYLLLLTAWAPVLAQAQPLTAGEAGSPFFARRYSADEYQLHNQNWAVAQDARGVIYVANTNGVLEYDGERWRTIRVPNELVRALSPWVDGRIYVGGVGELGYLHADSLGRMGYASLLGAVPEAHLGFADVWTTLATPDGVYFQTSDRLFRWDGSRMEVWTTDDRFHRAFVVGDTYYVREENVGLLRLVYDELEPVPGGDQFADERIDVMLPFGDDAALIRTRIQGFLVLDGDRLNSFPTEADAYLRDKRVYHGAVLHDGSYALTTLSGSVVVMDQAGRVQRILARDVGLEPDDLVLYAMPDQQHGLWLALDDGMLRVDVPAALTLLGPASGLQGTAYEMVRHQGRLYVGTTQGLYRLQPGVHLGARSGEVFEPTRFVPVDGVNEQCYALMSVDESLLAATNSGIYEVRGGRTRLVRAGKAFTLWRGEGDHHVLAGLKEGVAVLAPGPRGWEEAGRLERVTEEVRTIGRGPDGALWLGTLLNGVARVETDPSGEGDVAWYGEAEGLPVGPVLVWSSDEELAFPTLDGIYRIEQGVGDATPAFVPDTVLNAVIQPDGDTHFVISEGDEDGIWVARDRQVEVYRRDETGALVDETPPALHIPGIRVRSVYDEGNGVVWVASEEGLFRYDGTLGKTYAEPYQALVRGVHGKDGDLIYGGGGPSSVPEIPHDRNNFRFTFSAPTFNAPEATLYQYWLEGFDDGWSAWTDVTHKEYTNLPEDDYRFHVRARNAQGVVSREDAYAFEVLPPWWRTWWAYSLYVLGAAFVVWSYGQMKLRQHAFELEREREVNRQLETANVRLRQANERLQQADKLKDDFLANTSHELRTPLTSILGFASVLYEELEGEARTFASMIQQGGERLLATVNALLDMARLQADLMELEPADLDAVVEVQRIAKHLEPEAEAKGLYLAVAPKQRSIPAHLDRFCLERILTNVVGNAVKFTEEGGVTIVVDATDEDVLLTVRDTGIGIGEEFLPDLFSEFKQASSGYGRTYEGNGLGLAITQRLVHLLDGDIGIDSEVEHGTEVRIRLPRYDQRESVANVLDVEEQAPQRHDARLLLIESPDRPQARLQHILASLYDVDVVSGVEEGYEAAFQASYGLLLIDSQLPPMPSGHTLLEALRLTPGYGDTPALAVTTYSIPGDSELYRRLGFAGHIGKPITKQRVRRALDLARTPRAEFEA